MQWRYTYITILYIHPPYIITYNTSPVPHMQYSINNSQSNKINTEAGKKQVSSRLGTDSGRGIASSHHRLSESWVTQARAEERVAGGFHVSGFGWCVAGGSYPPAPLYESLITLVDHPRCVQVLGGTGAAGAWGEMHGLVAGLEFWEIIMCFFQAPRASFLEVKGLHDDDRVHLCRDGSLS